MVATKQDIRGWFQVGKSQGFTHMIVVCDSYDNSDYPVYVGADENVRKRSDEYENKSMQRVMEVYSLKMELETQMSEFRAFHYD